MIVSTTVEDTGSVTVTVDSDGDQGDAYSTEILDDLLTRACTQAVAIWKATREAGE